MLKFQNTKEALQYGQSIKGNKKALEILKEARKEAEKEVKRLLKQGKLKEALYLGSGQGQFLREAIEATN